MIWPFGTAHKNKRLEDLPDDYLEWVSRKWTKLGQKWKAAIEQELKARAQKGAYYEDTHHVTSVNRLKATESKTREIEKDRDGWRESCIRTEQDNQRLRLTIKTIEKDNDRLAKELANVRLQLYMANAEKRLRSGLSGNEGAEIRRVFRELALKWHPDHGGSDDAMKAINDFYQKLNKN